jgi:hypothetical protein
MIQIVTGKLGAGKTLYCVMLIFDALVKGRTVCTNIAVNFEELFALALRLHGVRIKREQLVYINPEKDPNWHKLIPWGVPGSPVEVVLDEIHLFFNARDWQKTHVEARSMLSYLTQSRKAQCNITFIAQEIKTVEAQFRALAEWELYVASSDHLPLGILKSLPWKCFIVAQRDATHGYLLRRIWRKYDKRFFRCYGSFTFLDKEMNEIAATVVKVEPFKLQRIGFLRRLFLNLLEDLRTCPVGFLRRYAQSKFV